MAKLGDVVAFNLSAENTVPGVLVADKGETKFDVFAPNEDGYVVVHNDVPRREPEDYTGKNDPNTYHVV